MRPEKIANGIHRYTDACNVYVVQSGDKAIAIDWGRGDILTWLESLGIREIEAILITHHHRDQVEGLKRAADRGIPIYVPETEHNLVSDVEAYWQAREINNNYNTRQDRFSILEEVDTKRLFDYATLTFESGSVFVMPSPGHTTGSVSLVMTLDSTVVAFTGDLIYAPGKVWSLAALQWTYNGGEGIPYTILSLLQLERYGVQCFFPSHGEPMDAAEAVAPTVQGLTTLKDFRRHNPRLFELDARPYVAVTDHVLFNRTSMANAYVLLSDSGKALMIDYGYDHMAGKAAGIDRSSRRPWLYTIDALKAQFGVKQIDAVIPTHYHDDHVAGINLLKRVYGTSVYASERMAGILERPSAYDLPCLWFEPIAVDERLANNATIHWEEYELMIYPLPGHTQFAVAIVFEADGKRFLCAGDQYIGDDGALPNYVYKNRLHMDDYVKAADLYRAIRPDIVLPGHSDPLYTGDKYFDDLYQGSLKMHELHKQLLPEQFRSGYLNDFELTMYPFQKTVKPGEEFDVHCVAFELPQESMELRIDLPKELELIEEIYEEDGRPVVAPLGPLIRTFRLRAGQSPARRLRITVSAVNEYRYPFMKTLMFLTIASQS